MTSLAIVPEALAKKRTQQKTFTKEMSNVGSKATTVEESDVQQT